MGVVAYLTKDMEDKVLGYMVMFSISDKMRVSAPLVQSLLTEYGYEGLIERPTPQKSFKKATQFFKNIREEKKIKVGKKEVNVVITYDTIEVKDKEYLIRKIKIEEKKEKADTERLALFYLDKDKVGVKGITKHIGSQKTVLTEKEIKKIEEILNNEFEEYLKNYDGKTIRTFVRDRVLRERCNAIPFVGRGGAWFVANNNEVIRHAENLKAMIEKIRNSAIGGKISIVFIPLFDSEDIKEKIKEEISREVTSRYKRLLSAILQKILYAKSGEQIENTLNDLLNGEDSIVKMLEEYAHIIKSSLRVEIGDLSTTKAKILDAIESKDIKVDVDKVKMILESVGNIKSEKVEVMEKEEEKEQKISLIDDERIKALIEKE